MPKVLIVIGDAIGDTAEALDTMYLYFRVQEDGFQVVVAPPDKRVYPLVMHEVPPAWDVASYHLASDIALRDVNPEEYAGLFLTGGRAPEYLREVCGAKFVNEACVRDGNMVSGRT